MSIEKHLKDNKLTLSKNGIKVCINMPKNKDAVVTLHPIGKMGISECLALSELTNKASHIASDHRSRNQGNPDTKRGTGRTQFTVDSVVRAIVDGQPYCHVVGENWEQVVDELEPRILDELRASCIPVTRKAKHKYDCDGVVLKFHSVDELSRTMRGSEAQHIDCEFWDHSAFETDSPERRDFIANRFSNRV